MMDDSDAGFYQKMFFVGALWNWSIAIPLLFGYPYLFPLLGMKIPNYTVFIYLMLCFVFVFGLGYYWVSKDINRNHGIVKMGIIAKLTVVVLVPWTCFIGEVAPLFLGTALGDFIFTLLFIRFLRAYARSKNG